MPHLLGPEREALKYRLLTEYQRDRDITALAEKYSLSPTQARKLINEAFSEKRDLPDEEAARAIAEEEYLDDIDLLWRMQMDNVKAQGIKSQSLSLPALYGNLHKLARDKAMMRGVDIDHKKIDVTQTSTSTVVTLQIDRAERPGTLVTPIDPPRLEVSDAEIISGPDAERDHL